MFSNFFPLFSRYNSSKVSPTCTRPLCSLLLSILRSFDSNCFNYISALRGLSSPAFRLLVEKIINLLGININWLFISEREIPFPKKENTAECKQPIFQICTVLLEKLNRNRQFVISAFSLFSSSLSCHMAIQR